MDFWGVYDVNIWGKNFARSTGKSTDNNDINIFLSLENPCTFCLGKKRPENAFLTLIVNYCKIIQEKQIMLFKTSVNCLFNDIWCYLVISCFDWKIGISQQTVVGVYCVFKADLHSTKVSHVTDAIRWQMVFFNLHLRLTKCSVYLTNLFYLLTIRSH